MFNAIPLTTMSNTTQRILSQTNNISYTARGVVRVNSTPDNRKADYLLRDFYMTLVTAYLTEIGFRGLETMYTIPLMSKALNLHQLTTLHPDQAQKNYARLPNVLRKHVLGSVVKPDSMYLVPELLDQQLEKGVLLQQTGESKEQLEVLIRHLYQQLNYPAYLDKYAAEQGLTAEGVNTIKTHLKNIQFLKGKGQKEIASELQELLAEPSEKQAARLEALAGKWRTNPLMGQAEKAQLDALLPQIKTILTASGKVQKKQLKEFLNGPLKNTFEEIALSHERHLGQLESKILDGHPLKDKIMTGIKEGLESEKTVSMLQRIQRSATWPKMITSISLTFVFYGLAANYFDVNILQPWQEKLVKERGHSKDVVAPAYQALIPGAAVFVAGMWDRITPKFMQQRLGYFSRFALAGAAALSVYTGTMLALIKKRLAQPAQPAVKSAAKPPSVPVPVMPPSAPVSPFAQQPMPSAPRAVNPYQAAFSRSDVDDD